MEFEKNIISKGKIAAAVSSIIGVIILISGLVGGGINWAMSNKFDELNAGNKAEIKALQTYTENRFETLQQSINRRFETLNKAHGGRLEALEQYTEDEIVTRIATTADRIRAGTPDRVSPDDIEYCLKWFDALKNPSTYTVENIELIREFYHPNNMTGK